MIKISGLEEDKNIEENIIKDVRIFSRLKKKLMMPQLKV